VVVVCRRIGHGVLACLFGSNTGDLCALG